jgi:serine/threonine protein kinase
VSDLKPENILVGIEDDSVIHELIEEEQETPAPFKDSGYRRVYARRNFGNIKRAPGLPKIADFGLAVVVSDDTPFNHPIQPDLLQAPEVILRAGWSYSADIWNLGVMVCVDRNGSGYVRSELTTSSDLGSVRRPYSV